MVNDILDFNILIIIGVLILILILINFIPDNYIEYYIDKKIDKYGYDVVKIFIYLLAGLVLVIGLIILLWFL